MNTNRVAPGVTIPDWMAGKGPERAMWTADPWKGDPRGPWPNTDSKAGPKRGIFQAFTPVGADRDDSRIFVTHLPSNARVGTLLLDYPPSRVPLPEIVDHILKVFARDAGGIKSKKLSPDDWMVMGNAQQQARFEIDHWADKEQYLILLALSSDLAIPAEFGHDGDRMVKRLLENSVLFYGEFNADHRQLLETARNLPPGRYGEWRICYSYGKNQPGRYSLLDHGPTIIEVE